MEDGNRYSNSPDYPRQGRYGDTTQRCAWCGRPTTYGDRCCTGGLFRRNYCSHTCRSAGDFYPNLVLAIFYPLVIILILWSYQAFPGTVIFQSMLFLVIYGGILPTICMWSCVFCGKSERKSELRGPV
ncbi:MAG: hypothetical protein RTV72_11575 [Candidatus Thorarchaeota archaeon]